MNLIKANKQRRRNILANHIQNPDTNFHIWDYKRCVVGLGLELAGIPITTEIAATGEVDNFSAFYGIDYKTAKDFYAGYKGTGRNKVASALRNYGKGA